MKLKNSVGEECLYISEYNVNTFEMSKDICLQRINRN